MGRLDSVDLALTFHRGEPGHCELRKMPALPFLQDFRRHDNMVADCEHLLEKFAAVPAGGMHACLSPGGVCNRRIDDQASATFHLYPSCELAPRLCGVQVTAFRLQG